MANLRSFEGSNFCRPGLACFRWHFAGLQFNLLALFEKQGANHADIFIQVRMSNCTGHVEHCTVLPG